MDIDSTIDLAEKAVIPLPLSDEQRTIIDAQTTATTLGVRCARFTAW